MSTWEVLKTLLAGAGFYWRKLLVFLVIVTVGIVGTLVWRSQSEGEAALSFTQNSLYGSTIPNNAVIEVQPNGQVLMGEKNLSSSLKIFPKYDELRILLIDLPGVFMEQFSATVILPAAVSQKEIEQQVIAIHGVASYNAYMSNSRTLVYEAEGISPQASLTIVARLPKNILNPPLGKKIGYFVSQLPAKVHLYVAFVLPLVTLIILLYMLAKRRRSKLFSASYRPVGRPPQTVPPAVVGALIEGWVGPRGIAATLIDLANRGYIFIIRKNDDFAFGKRKSMNLEQLPELKPFERTLLSKIFQPQEYLSRKEDVEMRVGHHIFSRKIAQSYLQIYDEASKVGYYIKNPGAVHLRWRAAGIALFLLGGLGFALTAFLAPDPKFTLFFWAGEMLAASAIMKSAPYMPVRSAFGDRALKDWLAFRQYLKTNRSIAAGADVAEEYLKYLPLAIVLGVEAEWTRRFLKESFIQPVWYESLEGVVTLESFSEGLFPIISYVSGTLDKSHEPMVE